ncbi:MAG: pantoate--beta-alanine ligase [Aquificaceae bacterium]|nr:pantoate--beta-alanine ligase [Aquificaceae bacterium]MDW8236893.1 pantoate--beta-alanine ligase [Aquificaceae bacterium]
MAELIRDKKSLKDALKSLKGEVGFVPTMGALHRGHIELIRRCKKENNVCVVSIFVNPEQFGANEDFEKYPRDIEKDLSICKSEGVDIVFAPEVSEIYPTKPIILLEIPGLTDVLEGKFRPGHFRGVCIVLSKLFNLIHPKRAYFGEKDFQQLIVVKKLVEELGFDIDIVPVPTVRDDDGLALSSRNAYLSKSERESARCIYQSFELMQELFRKNLDIEEIRKRMEDFILSHKHVVGIDYIEFTDDALRGVNKLEVGHRVLIAVRFESARLIDNWEVKQ